MTNNLPAGIVLREQLDESVVDVDLIDCLDERQDQVLLELDLLNARVEALINEIAFFRELKTGFESSPVPKAA